MPDCAKKGIILFIVIGVIMVVVLLSTVILRVVANQERLNHHQVSRIQAQYAAKAGVIYALDKLRNNTAGWSAVGTVVKRMCKTASGPDCLAPDVVEPDLPAAINYVDISIYGPNSGISNTRKVSAKATYTYTP